jgi:hypothetical protein
MIRLPLSLLKQSREELAQSWSLLEKYCFDHGWELEKPSSLDAEAYPTGKIVIGNLIKEPNRLFSFIHEIGHMKIWEEEKENKILRKSAVGFGAIALYRSGMGTKKYSGLDKDSKTKHYKAAMVEEEIDAWNKGHLIALSLGCKFNNELFEEHKSECVYGYIRYCIKPLEYESLSS